MTQEQRDLIWKCLPKEVRDQIRDIVKTSGMGIHGMFDLVFGGNVTSDTEPEEMLMVERKKVQELYARFDKYQQEATMELDKDFYKGEQNALVLLFGDKCLPDKAEPKPTFPIGSIVRITNKKNPYHGHKGKFGKVITYDAKYNRYAIEGIPSEWEEGDLEPYTEPSNVSTNDTKDDTKESRNLSQNTANCDKSKDNQLKDNMEEKANIHAEKIFADMVNKYQSAPWNEFRDALAQIYLAGATEALASQWRSPEALNECKDRKVITHYRSKFQGTWLTLTAIQDVEDWTTNKKDFHPADDLIAWMPIPELTPEPEEDLLIEKTKGN